MKIRTCLVAFTVAYALFVTPSTSAQDVTLTIAEASGGAGDTISVPVLLDATNVVAVGATLGIAHDDAVLVLVSISEGTDLLDTGSGGPFFWSARTETYGGTGGVAGFLVAMEDFALQPLPSEEDLEIVVFEYEINDEAEPGTVTDLEFTEELSGEEDAPAVRIEIAVEIDGEYEEDLPLTLEGGDVAVADGLVSITDSDPALLFRRGDVDGSGTTVAINDGLYLLRWGFQEGVAPPCMDAADTDDDGVVDALIDGVLLLRWGFTEGEAPAEPGPESCGTDSSEDDDLGCAVGDLTCDS